MRGRDVDGTSKLGVTGYVVIDKTQPPPSRPPTDDLATAREIVEAWLREDCEYAGRDFPRATELTDRFAAALTTARYAERLRAKVIADAEPEMPGDMPDSLWAACATREGAAEVFRAGVRAAKANIAAAILTEPGEQGRG